MNRQQPFSKDPYLFRAGTDEFQNYYKFSKKSLSQVAIAASLVPAKVIGLDNRMGSIAINKLADFIILNKDNLEIEETFISGK